MSALANVLSRFQSLNESAVANQSQLLQAQNQALSCQIAMVRIDYMKSVELLKALKAGEVTIDMVDIRPDGNWTLTAPEPKQAPAG